MKAIQTSLPGVVIIEPDVFGDHRGWFMETWSKKKLEELGIFADFVQDNQSFTAKKERSGACIFRWTPWHRQSLFA